MLMYSLQLPVGWQAPDFLLPDSNGNILDTAKLTPKRGILVIFTCNHCPYAKASWPIIAELYKRYWKRGIEFIAINPNDETQYPDDSIEKMAQKVNELGIPIYYVKDKNGEIAKKYDAQCTPDVFLLDKNRKLYYHGRINDNWKVPLKAVRNDLDDALRRLFIGDRPPVEQFPSMGCSIKRSVI